MFQLESSLEGMKIVNVFLWGGNAYSCNRATPALLTSFVWFLKLRRSSSGGKSPQARPTIRIADLQ
jgi:hypothetical protein